MKPASLLLRYILPALAGVTMGRLIAPESSSPGSNSSAAKASDRRDDNSSLPPLPDDPHSIRLAALGGRTAEAKQKVAELVARGADDNAIVQWLKPILLSDPGWMEHFIAMLPEERRYQLVQQALRNLASDHIDAPWEVLKHSPATMAFTRGPSRSLGKLIPVAALQSPQAAAFVLDPANGFTTEDMGDALGMALHEPANAHTMLEAWKGGRIPAGLPDELLQSAWIDLQYHEPEILESLMKGLSPEQENWVTTRERDKATRERNDEQLEDSESPPLEEVDDQVIQEYIAGAEERGQRVPLEKLAGLPEHLRNEAAQAYLTYTYPFHSAGVMEELLGLPSLGFSEQEQQRILVRAFEGEWSDCGNLGNALTLVEMMPDTARRKESRAELLESLVKYDPGGALEYAANLPAGEERARLEQQARENLR